MLQKNNQLSIHNDRKMKDILFTNETYLILLLVIKIKSNKNIFIKGQFNQTVHRIYSNYLTTWKLHSLYKYYFYSEG